MQNEQLPPMALIVQYNSLFTRYLLRLTAGNGVLTDIVIKEAMEELYEENKFHDGPQLRGLLKEKMLAKLKQYSCPAF